MRTLKQFLALLSLSAFAGLLHPVNAEEKLTITAGDNSVSYSLEELKKKLPVVTVSLDDPLYHQKKSFDGFDLTALIGLAGVDLKTASDEIVFTAQDGYAPYTSFNQLKKHRAVLAFQEHGTKTQFQTVPQGKSMISPAPYYLVWDEGKAVGKEVPWPYQLVKIEVVSFERKFSKIFPKGAREDSGVMKGFLTFKAECFRCHSVNLQGGELGPELNIPKNVTEYWDKKNLKEFIVSSSSFRLKSKMPPFPHLSGEGVENVIAYLEYMKSRKESP